MRANVPLWTARLLKLAAALLALSFLGLYLFLVFHRLQYPYELEWMEGAHVDYVRRILAGQPIYIRPSIEFTPFIYTPLYFYLSALVAKLTGFGLPSRGFFPLRLVSALSFLGCSAIIFCLVRRETRNWFAGLVSSCLFIATFQITGGFADIARVDSLFLFLFLAGAFALRRARSPAGFAVAGLLVSLSFLTKQTALFISLPLMVWALWTNRRGGLVFAGTVAVLVIGTTLAFDRASDGWYRYYVFLLPGQHAMVPKWLLGFWVDDVLRKLFVAVALALLYLGAALRKPDKRAGFFYLSMLAGMLGGAWISRLNEGAVENVLPPAYAGLCILLGLGLEAAERWTAKAEADLAQWLRAGLCVICIAQFGLLWYSPARHLPTQADREAYDGFIGMVSQMEGEVYMVHHGYLPALAGKRTHAHLAAVLDVIRHPLNQADKHLIAEFEKELGGKRYPVIVLDAWERPPGMRGNYDLVDRVFTREEAGWPVTGRQVRPQFILVPKGSSMHLRGVEPAEQPRRPTDPAE